MFLGLFHKIIAIANLKRCSWAVFRFLATLLIAIPQLQKFFK